MPDVPDVPLPKLDTRKAEQAAVLIAVCTAVAVVVLVIDWRIKQSILDAAKNVHKDLEATERWYWREAGDHGTSKLKSYTSSFDPSSKPVASGDYGVGRNAGMEETADPDEDTSSSWSREAIAEVSRIDRSAGSRSVEVPKGD